MEIKKPDFRNMDRKKLKYIVIAVILLCALAVYIYCRGGEPAGDVIQTEGAGTARQISAEEEKKAQNDGKDSGGYIYVDVSGAVNTPMVVCIPEGSRVFEAIDAAGGKSAEASVKDINLAASCEDGQKVYVPTTEETAAAQAQGTGTAESSGGTAAAGPAGAQGNGQSPASDAQKGKININTAGSEELQTITGVGPAIASRIIDYRNTSGPFKSVEDLTNVSGIGEKTYEKLKDQVCV